MWDDAVFAPATALLCLAWFFLFFKQIPQQKSSVPTKPFTACGVDHFMKQVWWAWCIAGRPLCILQVLLLLLLPWIDFMYLMFSCLLCQMLDSRRATSVVVRAALGIWGPHWLLCICAYAAPQTLQKVSGAQVKECSIVWEWLSDSDHCAGASCYAQHFASAVGWTGTRLEWFQASKQDEDWKSSGENQNAAMGHRVCVWAHNSCGCSIILSQKARLCALQHLIKIG